MVNTINLPPEAIGHRLDQWVADHSAMTRSAFKRLVSQESVTLDNVLVTKAGMRITNEGELYLQDKNISYAPSPMALDIVYEDDDLLIVNKPRHLLVYPAKDKSEITLVNGLLAHTTLSDYCGGERPGVVHRIDRDTSGLVLVAKNNNVHKKLYAQLAAHEIEREYIGIACHPLEKRQGSINKPIAHDYTQGIKRTTVTHGGQEAITHFVCVYQNNAYALMRFHLETGRTHQIRVHMASIGHPLVGDGLYGEEKNIFGFHGQALHALRLRFFHPITGARIEAIGKPPEILKKAVTRIQMMK